MSEAKPTPGVWKWDSDPMKGDPFGRMRYRVVTTGKTITQCYYSSSDEHAESDARLIADAGTVYNQTGLTPSQLVERVRELEGALQACAAVCAGETMSKRGLIDALDRARAALAKSTSIGDTQCKTTN